MAKFGHKITSAGATEVELQFDGLSESSFGYSQVMLYIQTDPANTGTIQFSTEDTIGAEYYAWPADKTIPWKISGSQNLRYKASATGQSFVVLNMGAI